MQTVRSENQTNEINDRQRKFFDFVGLSNICSKFPLPLVFLCGRESTIAHFARFAPSLLAFIQLYYVSLFLVVSHDLAYVGGSLVLLFAAF